MNLIKKIVPIALLFVCVNLFAQSSINANNGKPKVDPYEANQVKNTVLRLAANPIQDCFKSWEKDQKTFTTGKIFVDWEIQPNGKVKNANIIHSDIKALDKCVLATVKKLEFPTPPNNNSFYVAHKFFFKNETSNK